MRKNEPLRVLHVGNIANNAYNNAKVQRQHGIEADVLCFDYYHIMGCPEWEDADFTGEIEDPFYPNWWACDLKGFKRPRWFVQGPLLLSIKYLMAFAANDQIKSNQLWDDLNQKRMIICGAKGSIRRLPSFLYRILSFVKLQLNHIKEIDLFLNTMPRRIMDAKASFLNTMSGIIMDAKAKAKRCYLIKFESPILDETKSAALSLLLFIYHAAMIPIQIVRFLFIYHVVRFLFVSLSFFIYHVGKISIEIVSFYLSLLLIKLPLFLIKMPNRIRDEELYEKNLLIRKNLIAEFEEKFPDRKDQLSNEDLHAWSYYLPLWKKLFEQYDVVQMYSTYPIIPLLCGFEYFTAYEHGTIREIPFEDNAQGRICAIGYKMAPVVFVTNSDNLLAAERLGLNEDQVYCLPHAFDNEKLFRFSDENIQRFNPPKDRVIFFSPARQHWKDRDPSMAKGNDYVFHAVRELKDEGFDFLVELIEWGRDVKASKKLIRKLGIKKYIRWVQPMKKRQLWQKYMSVHAVIDQLLLPALGGVGFETMAMGRRLLSAMDIKGGKKFFGAPPVMFDVCDTTSVKLAMLSVLEDPEDNRGIGNGAREWIKDYHSADRVCQIQIDAYRKILMKKGEKGAKKFA
jgi:glycosyltransferase involved in cell wall biosynthesis